MLFEPGMSCQLCSFTSFYVCVILVNKMMMRMMMNSEVSKQAASLTERDNRLLHTILGYLGVWGYFWGI